MSDRVLLLLGITLMYSTPLVFAAQGSVISEVAGVVNIGIEGMMTIGAFTGAAVAYMTGNPWIGFVAAGLAGAFFGLIHAFASVTCKSDQTVCGIAMNLVGPGFALFMCRLIFDGGTQTPPVSNKIPRLCSHGLAGSLNNLNVDMTTLIALIISVLMVILFYGTTWGLHLRAVGEHPAAADTLGIDVYKVRYTCVILSGALAGLGGAAMTLSILSQFMPTAISGQGFIAIAAVIFGKWTPHGSYLACLLFGFAQALTVVLGGGAFSIPSEILAMLPYVMTLLVLILFVGRSSAPKANGVPYNKGSRV
ncbi:MAG: ABC transporter permease [Lachnospiraceae bacterium]|nr:ABC transporter permease [Lachnospiraceae bacterium]